MSWRKKLISLLVDLDSALDWTVHCSFSRVLRKHETSETSPIIIDQCSWNFILCNFSTSFRGIIMRDIIRRVVSELTYYNFYPNNIRVRFSMENIK